MQPYFLQPDSTPSPLPATDVGCQVSEHLIGAKETRLVRLENDWMTVSILPAKGADIYELIYKPQNLDVLWKSPWAANSNFNPAELNLKLSASSTPPAGSDSRTTWLEAYEGGWQVLFPNGGDACHYGGVEQPFHGEASWVSWDYKILEATPQVVEVELTTRLQRSPFRLERHFRLEATTPVLTIRERITNESQKDLTYMWGQHPAYGAPFLGEDCYLDVPAHKLQADADFNGPFNPLIPGQIYEWPLPTNLELPDLAQVPAEMIPRQLLGYFREFNEGWYSLTNRKLGFGVGLVWPVETFPYAWFWQEMYGSEGFPWYKSSYVMAVEPSTSWPAHGLVNVNKETGTQRILGARETIETELKVVFYASKVGVERISPGGAVIFKQEQ